MARTTYLCQPFYVQTELRAVTEKRVGLENMRQGPRLEHFILATITPTCNAPNIANSIKRTIGWHVPMGPGSDHHKRNA